MYDNFYKINDDKQKRILYAAMLEFSRFGYDKTSMDQVAKAAGISKSMVFHYFGNKLSLYEFLINYSSDYILGQYENYISKIKNLDYLERYQVAAVDKIKSLSEEGPIFRFSGSLFLHPLDIKISKETQDKLKSVKDLHMAYAKVLQNDVNGSKLRKDIDKNTALKYIKWLMDGYSQELIAKMQALSLADADFSQDWEDFDLFLADLKKLFYIE